MKLNVRLKLLLKIEKKTLWYRVTQRVFRFDRLIKKKKLESWRKCLQSTYQTKKKYKKYLKIFSHSTIKKQTIQLEQGTGHENVQVAN